MLHDWRGSHINNGDTVIYFIKTGPDIVEGTVTGFTDGGRVRVDVSRRRSGARIEQTETQVAPHNLTVIV